jgi:hypothetical protein
MPSNTAFASKIHHRAAMRRSAAVTEIADALQRRREAVQPSGAAGCRWPLWDDIETPTHAYCGEATEAGRPYCALHSSIAYTGGTAAVAAAAEDA